MADLKTPSRRSKKGQAHETSEAPSLSGDRLKRLLDPLILPTVDEFPKLTCGWKLNGRCLRLAAKDSSSLCTSCLFFLQALTESETSSLWQGQAFNVCWPAGSSGTLLQPVYDMVAAQNLTRLLCFRPKSFLVLRPRSSSSRHMWELTCHGRRVAS